MRAAANTLWLKGAEVGGDTPDLIHPYFESTEDLSERMKLLDAKVVEINAAKENNDVRK